MDKEKQAQILELHEQWLKHPITGMFRSRLKFHSDRLLELVCQHSSDPSINDDQIRREVYNIKGINTILEMFNHPESIIMPPQ